MIADTLSQRISELSKRLDDLQAKCVSTSANAPEILLDALKSLQISIDDLLVAEKLLKQKNEENAKSVGESTDSLALVHELQVHQIELEMQNEELKRAKLETEEAFAKYTDLYDFSPIGLFTLNAQGQILESNLAGAALIGMERSDLRNKPFRHFVAPVDRLQFDDFRKLAFEKPVKHTCELSLLRDKLPAVYVHIDGTAVENRSLNIKQIRIAIIDITERKCAEEALRVAWAYNRSLIEASLDPLVTIGPDGKITDVNAATERATGYRFEELVGTDFSNYFTDPKSARAGYEKVFKEGYVRDYPLEIQARDGNKTPVLYNASIYRDKKGRVGGIFAAARDITKRKHAEAELDKYRNQLEDLVVERTFKLEAANAQLNAEIEERKQAEKEREQLVKRLKVAISKQEHERSQLEAIFAAQNDAILIYDKGMNVQRVNPSFIETYGFDPIGLNVKDIIQRISCRHLDGRPLVIDEQPTPRALRGERVAGACYLVTKADGTEIAVETSSGPIRSEGCIIGSVTVWRDITERVRAVEALQSAKDELERKVHERTEDLSKSNEKLQIEIEEHQKARKAAEAAAEAKAAFLANMSHELRTPLNAVIGFSSLLLDDNLTQTQKEYIDSIRNGGQALLSIISDILELSKAEREKIVLEHQPFSLKHCIEEAMDLVAIQAEQKGLGMVSAIAYGTPDTIISDHDRLRQILVNLLSNAIKFTDVGDISISVSSKAIAGNKCRITFAVKDTGIGMPKDKMDRLFQPFTQLEYVISRKRDGAGLGLAICKKHVELLGGEIWAESEAGKGSTFKFAIPVEVIQGKQLDSEDKGKATKYGILSGQKPLSILVADDIPSNQKVLVEMLKGLGYRADAVADGIEVLKALQIRPYDLILMDIRMPQMDGIAATKEIRKLWPDKGPKVVAITAFAMDGDKEKFLDAGMDGYIAKPVKVEDLFKLLSGIA